MIELQAAKHEERFFSDLTKSWQLPRLLQAATTTFSKKWVKYYLENYFLSSYFNDKTCVKEISKSNKQCPEYYRNSDKPVCEVSLSDDVLYDYIAIVRFLNSFNTEIKLDVPTAVKQYKKYVNSISKRNQKVQAVLVCNNNYVWYKLLNKEALEYESLKMHNCIGNDDRHVKDILSNKYTALSLRKNGNPHITLKYNSVSKVLTDIVGKNNSNFKNMYTDAVLDVLNYLHLQPQLNNFKTIMYDGKLWRKR